MLLRLLQARGHAAHTDGSHVEAVREVQRLLQVGEALVVVGHGNSNEEVVFPITETFHRIAEQQAAGLLSAIATAPGLPPEVGPALAAAAEDAWGTTEAVRRLNETLSLLTDDVFLRVLGPDALEFLRTQGSFADSLEQQMQTEPVQPKQGVIGEALDRIRDEIDADPIIPTAAFMRGLWKSCHEFRTAVERRDMKALAPGGPFDDILAAALRPQSIGFRRTVADEARVAVARTAAAIRAFQLREGRPPRTLDELVPSTVREVPLDPFDGNSLQYEVNGDSWRVASRNWGDFGTVPAGSREQLDTFEVVYPRVAK
jgi:hypothetical protein